MYPIQNNSRNVFPLSGLWDFRFANDETWQTVYVPASYNNQLTDPRSRYYCGEVEYHTTFSIPEILKGNRVILRFDAVTHDARVLIDGNEVLTHKGGFLPFEIDLTDHIPFGKNHDLNVFVNNRIDHESLPIGNVEGTSFFGSDNPGIPSVENGKKKLYNNYNLPNFDFFNYSGIHRPARIISMPKAYIDDVTIKTISLGERAELGYAIKLVGTETVSIEVLDESGKSVAKAKGQNGVLSIGNPQLWNPKPAKPYLYKIIVKTEDDEYSLNFGIRTVEVKDNAILINKKPFYFKGAGKHEDSFIRGRGLDECLNVKDMGLLHWLNANSVRTSHYPYAEEFYDLCDREGIVVIDELPAVGLNFQGQINPYKDLCTFPYHQTLLKELIERDKNHACVVMWSLGNEPDSEHFPEDAKHYWCKLKDKAHEWDPQNRPVTFVCCQNDYTQDIATREMDVVCINRYYGWYNLSGCLDEARAAFAEELDFWQKIGKPVILTEYGADSLPGMHAVIPEMFTEEYQIDYLKAINSCLDERNFIAGEMPWGFADFDTQQGPMRAGGNHKGIFTRDRAPKMVAHYLKQRWGNLN